MASPESEGDGNDGPRRREARGGDEPGGSPRAGALAERRWSLVAALCLVAAVMLWLLVGVDAAFVVATFGLLAWFWDQRNRIERRAIERGGGRALADEAEGEDFEDEVEDEVDDEAEGEVEGEDYDEGVGSGEVGGGRPRGIRRAGDGPGDADR